MIFSIVPLSLLNKMTCFYNTIFQKFSRQKKQFSEFSI
ncbi:hypothetical protein SIN_1216 [Streptococcus infantis SK1302]|uniref:Uncharacterized protein n=1 Tax=Streptococcus infantis SK1302 TaxID=871237 RepID=A0ABP2J359_9STRE|nr:hypothetical protein SIN_1216 [Streptococcus infantis SK1302]